MYVYALMSYKYTICCIVNYLNYFDGGFSGHVMSYAVLGILAG